MWVWVQWVCASLTNINIGFGECLCISLPSHNVDHEPMTDDQNFCVNVAGLFDCDSGAQPVGVVLFNSVGLRDV